MNKRELIVRFLNHLAFILGSVVSYLPVLGGLLGAMIIAAGSSAIIIYMFWDILVVLLRFILLFVPFPGIEISSNYYFVGFIHVPSVLVPFYIILTVSSIIFGCVLFGLGIISLTKERVNQNKDKKSRKLVQIGIYGVIRHPQNIGLILLFLGITLFIPLTWIYFPNIFIRIGDLYSWLLFAFIWLIEAKWEEQKLFEQINLNGAYKKYKEEVPAFIPYGKNIEEIFAWLNFERFSFKVRCVLWILIYISVIFLLTLALDVQQTLIITDTK